MKLRSRLVCFCHEEFIILDGQASPAGYSSFRAAKQILPFISQRAASNPQNPGFGVPCYFVTTRIENESGTILPP